MSNADTRMISHNHDEKVISVAVALSHSITLSCDWAPFTSRKGVLFYQKISPKHVQFHQKNLILILTNFFRFCKIKCIFCN